MYLMEISVCNHKQNIFAVCEYCVVCIECYMILRMIHQMEFDTSRTVMETTTNLYHMENALSADRAFKIRLSNPSRSYWPRIGLDFVDSYCS